MSFHYRCNRNACRQRKTLPRPIEQYIRTPKCECGGNLHRDKWVKPYNRKIKCYCQGVVNPRDGSVYPHNTYHPDCDNYVKRDEREWDEISRDLGAVKQLPKKDGEIPF